MPSSLYVFVPHGLMESLLRDPVQEVLDLSAILDADIEERGGRKGSRKATLIQET